MPLREPPRAARLSGPRPRWHGVGVPPGESSEEPRTPSGPRRSSIILARRLGLEVMLEAPGVDQVQNDVLLPEVQLSDGLLVLHVVLHHLRGLLRRQRHRRAPRRPSLDRHSYRQVQPIGVEAGGLVDGLLDAPHRGVLGHERLEDHPLQLPLPRDQDLDAGGLVLARLQDRGVDQRGPAQAEAGTLDEHPPHVVLPDVRRRQLAPRAPAGALPAPARRVYVGPHGTRELHYVL
mmetsp:Transcript_79376/g.210753  ORF Transcript_79376/g.210753 Transcript_79376/m.210753 type:complete len:234 (+) Transcript_79376:133-834(+)